MVDNRLGDLLGVFATNNHQGVFAGLILPQDDRAFLVIVDRDARLVRTSWKLAEMLGKEM
jgi:hypothetical protein